MMTYKIATVYELHAFELVKFILVNGWSSPVKSFKLSSQLCFRKFIRVYEFQTNTGLRAVLPLTKSKAGKLSLSYRVPLLFKKHSSWDVLPPPGDLPNCSDVSINDLGHQLLTGM